MKHLCIAIFSLTFSLFPAKAESENPFTVGDLKIFLDAYIEIPETAPLSEEQEARAAWFLAYSQGIIDGLLYADATLEPKNPILLHTKNDHDQIYKDFRSFLLRHKNLKDEANGYNVFLSFLLKNYTENPKVKMKGVKMFTNEVIPQTHKK